MAFIRQRFLGLVHTQEAGLLDDYDEFHLVNLVNLLDSRLYRVVEIVDWSLLGLHKAMPVPLVLISLSENVEYGENIFKVCKTYNYKPKEMLIG